ncbi:hypothetical protein SAMD00019534_048920, partial [Acytostelium subglobosum LB1]|uniref:hypothetical protein n=1 Tax=Acytostelium subglobosum LB1 TaxID=1410327 RepID=UPI000644D273
MHHSMIKLINIINMEDEIYIIGLSIDSSDNEDISAQFMVFKRTQVVRRSTSPH